MAKRAVLFARTIGLGLGPALGLALCLPVAEARATDWGSVAGWDVYEVDASRCAVGRVFAETATTFGIIMSLNGETRVFATHPGWAVRSGQIVPAQVALDGQPSIAGRPVAMEQAQNKGFVAAAAPGFLARFAAARQLGLSAGPSSPPQQLQLFGNAAGVAQGRRCLDNLRQEASVRISAPVAALPRQSQTLASPAPASQAPAPQASTRIAASVPPPRGPVQSFLPTAPSPAAPSRAVGRPVPLKPRSTWVEADDYPDAALRAEQEGSVTVKLAINRSGEVSECDVVQSSGSSVLDGATCKTIRRRARYTPATDAAGQPVESVDNHTVRWTLPR